MSLVHFLALHKKTVFCIMWNSLLLARTSFLSNPWDKSFVFFRIVIFQKSQMYVDALGQNLFSEKKRLLGRELTPRAQPLCMYENGLVACNCSYSINWRVKVVQTKLVFQRSKEFVFYGYCNESNRNMNIST